MVILTAYRHWLAAVLTVRRDGILAGQAGLVKRELASTRALGIQFVRL